MSTILETNQIPMKLNMTRNDFLKTGFWIALILMLIMIAVFFWRAAVVVSDLPDLAERQIREQGELTRSAARQLLETQLADTRKSLEAELNSTRLLLSRELAATRSEVRGIATMADRRLASLQGSLEDQLMFTRKSLDGRLGEFNANLQGVLQPAGSVAKQFAEAAPLFLDCDHNADCAFNRWVGLSRGVEKMADAGGRMSVTLDKSLPPFLDNTNHIAHNVGRFTDKFVEKKPFYRYVLDAAPGALAIWKVFK
jgi:hypothetical protein